MIALDVKLTSIQVQYEACVIRLTPEAEEVYQFLKIKAPVILVDLSTIENTIRYSDTRIKCFIPK